MICISVQRKGFRYLIIDSNVLGYVGNACHWYVHIVESWFRRTSRQRRSGVRGRRGLRIHGGARCRSHQFLYRSLRLLLVDGAAFGFFVRMRQLILQIAQLFGVFQINDRFQLLRVESCFNITADYAIKLRSKTNVAHLLRRRCSDFYIALLSQISNSISNRAPDVTRLKHS